MSYHVLPAMLVQMRLVWCWLRPRKPLIKLAFLLMLARMLRLFWAIKTVCLLLHHLQGPLLKGRRSHLVNVRPLARLSAFGLTQRP